jgi:GTP cyclohydrolase II
VTPSADTSSAPTSGINGDAAALTLDRAVGELRRGRAVRVVAAAAGGVHQSLMVAAVEAVQTPLLRRLESSGRELRLFLTAERAHAAGLVGSAEAAVSVTVAPGSTIEDLRALSCVSPMDPTALTLLCVDASPSHASIAEAGFKLAKAGRLLPALIGVETDDLKDDSLLEISVDAIEQHVRFAARSLKRMSQSRVPLSDSTDCELALFRDEHGLGEHVAVLIGNPDMRSVVPVRLHSACLTGDLLGSLRCDCGEQLRTAVARIAALGGGVLLYLDQEGRGIGLANKLRAYALQDNGLDTIDADRHLGFLSDERNYDVAAELLRQLGASRIRLMTNNPHKIAALRAHGIEVVGRLPLIGRTNAHNERYLRAKRDRAGHLAEDA